MTDENDTLRRIIERVIHDYLDDIIARRIAEDILEEMRRAGIKTTLVVPRWPTEEDC